MFDNPTPEACAMKTTPHARRFAATLIAVFAAVAGAVLLIVFGASDQAPESTPNRAIALTPSAQSIGGDRKASDGAGL